MPANRKGRGDTQSEELAQTLPVLSHGYSMDGYTATTKALKVAPSHAMQWYLVVAPSRAMQWYTSRRQRGSTMIRVLFSGVAEATLPCCYTAL